MTERVYVELARVLDSIPPGLPPTESGVEFELLARLYTPDEALLVINMRLAYESAGDIAARAGAPPAGAFDTLKSAARRGLIRTQPGEQGPLFALNPQTAGIAGLAIPVHRHDSQLAVLAEQYFHESRGGSLSDAPAAYRIIPVRESISLNLTIHPYEQADEMLASAKSWGALNCICRLRTRQAGRGCDHPLESCLVFAPVEGAFDGDELIRAIDLEEALRILREAEDRGLVHSTGNFGDHHYNICNCCACCCGLLRGIMEFDRPTVMAHSDFFMTVEESECVGCGDCLERCHFGALSLVGGLCAIDRARCLGCGLCALACSPGALSLQRRPEGETPPRPADFDEWMTEHAEARGIPLAELR
jgi:ferredoxin